MSESGTSLQGSTLPHSECVEAAIKEILGSMCGLEISPLEDKDLSAGGVLVAVISIMGEVQWSIFIGLPAKTAEALMVKFAGFEITFASDDMGDAVGELANILAGDVKRKLVAKGVKCNISLPSVIRAESLHVLVQRASTVARTCYSTDVGEFWTGLVSLGEGGFVV